MPLLKGYKRKPGRIRKSIKKLGRKVKPKIKYIQGVGTRYNNRVKKHFVIYKPDLKLKKFKKVS